MCYIYVLYICVIYMSYMLCVMCYVITSKKIEINNIIQFNNKDI
jgi:hypothetical protein